MICLWDIISGQQVRTWNFGGYQFLDGEVASTGQLMAFSDMQGRYTIVGVKQFWERYIVAPGEQFFLTDYQPLVRDLNEFVVDAATQVNNICSLILFVIFLNWFSRLCLIYYHDNRYAILMEPNMEASLSPLQVTRC